MTRVMRGRRRYHEPRRYAAVAGHRRQRSSSVGSYLAVAGLIGAAVGGGWAMTDHERQQAFITNAKEIAVDVGKLRARATQDGYHWRGRDDASASRHAPIYRGDTGYCDGMGGDSDGIACEHE